MKRISTLVYTSACIAAVAAFAAGCQKDSQNGGGTENTEPPTAVVNFTAKASDITTQGATVTITHDGTKDNTFYGFCYSDLNTSAEAAITSKIAELKAAGTKLSDVLFSGTSYRHALNGLEPGTTYRYVAFGLDKEGNTYGNSAAVTFTTAAEQEVEMSGYEKWLGTWTVTGANGVSNTVVIRANVTDQSYFLSGWYNWDYDINCNYNDDGSLSIISTDLEDYTDQNYGTIDMWFFGNYIYSDGNTYTITGDYEICNAALTNDDNAIITGNSIEVEGGSSVNIAGMNYCGLILEGEYAGYVLNYIGEVPTLPAIMTRTAATASMSTFSRQGRTTYGTVSASVVPAI